PDPALDLIRRAVLDDREDVPRRDAVARTVDPSLRELLVDHELLERFRLASPRLRPVRLDVAGLEEFRELLIGRQRRDLFGNLAGLRPELFGLRWEVESELSFHTGDAQVRDVARGRVRVDERDEGRRAPEEHVSVVLPREADAAVDLDVE